MLVGVSLLKVSCPSCTEETHRYLLTAVKRRTRVNPLQCVCVCSVSGRVAPRVSVSVEADELAVELGQRSGHGSHFLPLAPPTVVHLHNKPQQNQLGLTLFFYRFASLIYISTTSAHFQIDAHIHLFSHPHALSLFFYWILYLPLSTIQSAAIC